jgi:hypothetical protein
MKNSKNIVLGLLLAISAASCTKPEVIDATVVSDAPKKLAARLVLFPGDGYCNAVTKFGDTIQVVVEEKTYLNSKMPYKAKVRIPELSRFAFVESELQR